MSINEQQIENFYKQELEDPSEELKRKLSTLGSENTWAITDALGSLAAAHAILRKQPKELKIIFKDDEAEHNISLEALTRVFERTKDPIKVTVKCFDSFYNKSNDELQRDTKILSICLSKDK